MMMAIIPAKRHGKQGSKMKTGARETRETIDLEGRKERLIGRV